jgi:hypothetical protein
MQLIVILSMGVFLALVGMFFLVLRSMAALKSVAEQALLASKAVSSRDLAEAREYSLDAAMSREVAKDETGPAVATFTNRPDTYTTPDGTVLNVIKPFM